MNNQDDQLHRLLQQWKEIEPRADFDAQVWRRIRQTEPEPSPTFADWLRGWLPQPAFALAAAVIIGIGVGITSGISSVPAIRPTEQIGFLAPNTLTGSYFASAQR